MLPLAPVLFSTTTYWPQTWDNWAATIRAVASTPPPAAIGQMMRNLHWPWLRPHEHRAFSRAIAHGGRVQFTACSGCHSLTDNSLGLI
jgi:hypothetical protein